MNVIIWKKNLSFNTFKQNSDFFMKQFIQNSNFDSLLCLNNKYQALIF